MADQQPIDDALLGKFLAGETDPAESARVRSWLAGRTSGPAESGQEDFDRFERIWNAATPGPPAVDTDAAWRSVQQKIRLKDRSPVTRSRSDIKKVPIPPEKYRIGGYQVVWRVAAVLALVAGMGWLIYRLRYMGDDHAAARLITLTTNEQKISKTLPDGTRILLNRHSTLRYPATFSEERREVTLTGEAYFDVKPDAARPFRIEARNSVVQVLGTSFSVKAYDANVSVAVRTGKVRFSSGHQAVLLTKNQQATVEASADTIRRNLGVSPNMFAYKTGVLVFTNEPLNEVVKAINSLYSSDIRLGGDKIANCRLTTRFDKLPLDTVLSVTAETFGLQVRYEGKQIILTGTGCQ